MKRPPTAWEKILANYVTGKGLISKIYKKLGIFKNQKMAKDLNRLSSKKDIQIAKRHKKMLNIVIISEMKIKTTRKYCLTSVRKAIIKKSTNNKSWRRTEEKGIPLHCWWECKLMQLLWKTV